MQSYLLTLLSAAMITAVIGLLSPKGGLSKHVKLLTSLFLLCVLLHPIGTFLTSLRAFLNGEIELPDLSIPNEDTYQEQLHEALESASTVYFTQMLTQMLQEEFSIDAGDLRCEVRWTTEQGSLKPERVTVILSGRAIWKDPEAIEALVSERLGCECVSAIE